MSSATENRGFRIGLMAVLGLIVLRVALGWLFFYEGWSKHSDPNFSAAGYLQQAKGPLAGHFRSLTSDPRQWLTVPDKEAPENRVASLEPITVRWQRYVDGLESKLVGFGHPLSDWQRSQADKFAVDLEYELAGKLAYTPAVGAEVAGIEAIEEYLNELARLELAEAETAAAGANFQQRETWSARSKLQGALRSWKSTIGELDLKLANRIDDILTEPQRTAGRPDVSLALGDALRQQQISKLVTYGTLAVGVCLMLGLFTRLACLGGALFMLLVVLAQPAWPTIYPPAPPTAGNAMLINKEAILMLCLVAMAMTPVGRWGGLDFFIHRSGRRLLGGDS